MERSVLNWSMSSCRSSTGVAPSNLRNRYPIFSKKTSKMSNILPRPR